MLLEMCIEVSGVNMHFNTLFSIRYVSIYYNQQIFNVCVAGLRNFGLNLSNRYNKLLFTTGYYCVE